MCCIWCGHDEYLAECCSSLCTGEYRENLSEVDDDRAKVHDPGARVYVDEFPTSCNTEVRIALLAGHERMPNIARIAVLILRKSSYASRMTSA